MKELEIGGRKVKFSLMAGTSGKVESITFIDDNKTQAIMSASLMVDASLFPSLAEGKDDIDGYQENFLLSAIGVRLRSMKNLGITMSTGVVPADFLSAEIKEMYGIGEKVTVNGFWTNNLFIAIGPEELIDRHKFPNGEVIFDYDEVTRRVDGDSVYFDGNSNLVRSKKVGAFKVVTFAFDDNHGYIMDDNDAIVTWFGYGERFASVHDFMCSLSRVEA